MSPHPDDESIGAPCTLLGLQESGWDIVNLVCSLGRQPDWDRRRAEADCAATRAGFRNVYPPEPIRMSSGDNQRAARQAVSALIEKQFDDLPIDLVVGPHPEDRHHAHVTVAHAIEDSLTRIGRPIRWWMWGIWRELPEPTMFVPCTERHLRRSASMVAAYRGENDRNRYNRIHWTRRKVNAVMGAEQVFGFGSPNIGVEYAELLTERIYEDGKWRNGAPRLLSLATPASADPDHADAVPPVGPCRIAVPAVSALHTQLAHDSGHG